MPVEARANGETTIIALNLAPYESRLIIFHPGHPAAARASTREQSTAVDISSNWTVTFAGLNKTVEMPQLRSWTDDKTTVYYSGQAVYEKSIELPAALTGGKVILDFGAGEPVTAPAGHVLGMRALLESPVRECAIAYINEEKAGSIWHPPYEIDISRFLKPGPNQLRIAVANLAINELAGKALPSYRLLNLRYGERFVPQGYEGLRPLPSGILGHVQLVTR
jgi:hypothetical protein